MEDDRYAVDWDFLRRKMLRLKGSDSYIAFLESVPGIGKTTVYRFLKGERELDLRNLLIAVDACNLYIEDVITERRLIPGGNLHEPSDR